MGGMRKVFNSLTGEWEEETRGHQNSSYQLFHQTGSCDPMWSDPDVIADAIAGRPKRIPQRRTVITLSVAAETVAKLEDMVEITRVNRGRIVDALVRIGRESLREREKGNGQTEGTDGTDELVKEAPPRRRR